MQIPGERNRAINDRLKTKSNLAVNLAPHCEIYTNKSKNERLLNISLDNCNKHRLYEFPSESVNAYLFISFILNRQTRKKVKVV